MMLDLTILSRLPNELLSTRVFSVKLALIAISDGTAGNFIDRTRSTVSIDARHNGYSFSGRVLTTAQVLKPNTHKIAR